MGRLLARVSQQIARAEPRSFADQWLSEYLLPSQQQVVYNGIAYPLGANPAMPGLNQTLAGTYVQSFEANLPGHSAALRSCPPAFASQLVRALVLSQARFTWRNRPGSGASARKTFGTADLAPLETPWPNGTTADLIGRMEWHAGLAGNAFVTRRQRGRLRLLRPDWTAVLWGSDQAPEHAADALDGEVIGYVYVPGGFNSGNRPESLAVSEVAHWCPIPDPQNPGVGMSWVTPALREIQGDLSATRHKLKFFENGATPNMIVKGIPAVTKEQFDSIVDMLESKHAGVTNAYRTMYLTAGADASVVGSNLAEMDFSQTLATGETRISVLSRVPAALLGVTEGLKGSSLNEGNFGMARRIFADTWVLPTLQSLATSLAPMLKVPKGAELWFDTYDMPLLREDAADAAGITQVQATTIVSLVNAGFNPDRATQAVTNGDLSTLIGQHSGMLSVQLQAPGTGDVRSQETDSAARLLQQVYLAVGKVITVREAREIVSQASGISLPSLTTQEIFANLPPSPASGGN